MSRSATKKEPIFLPAAAALVLLVLFLWPQPKEVPPLFTDFSGETMHTSYGIRLAGSLLPSEKDNLERQIKAALTSFERRFSPFDPRSEISALNAAAADDPYPVSKDLRKVLEIGVRISKETGGAFNVALGPLIDAWGFGVTDGQEKPDVETLLPLTVPTAFTLKAGTVIKKDKDVSFNLSAIAKGYAVDLIARILGKNGYKNYLVEIGGEVVARGYRHPKTRDKWRIAVDRPDLRRQESDILHVKDMAMASSGDYRRFRMENGRRISHTIDPRTGHPITHHLAGVTVLGSECMITDAYATAMMVMGLDQAMAFAKKMKLPAAFFVREEDGSIGRHTTAAYDKILAASPKDAPQ